MSNYSIIIPVYNEEASLPFLLNRLQIYIKNGNEVIIVDDGSTDNSTQILQRDKTINLIQIKDNRGKGYAIKKGLEHVINEKIIIFDGDLEIDTDEIKKLMILNKGNNIYSAMGYRFEKIVPWKSKFDLGNFSQDPLYTLD